MATNVGMVYLVQPAILLRTDRFKIGMSGKNTITRIKSYGSDCRIICIRECANPAIVEKELIHICKARFTLLQGSEWFSGNKRDMIAAFDAAVNSHAVYDESNAEVVEQTIPEYEANAEYEAQIKQTSLEKFLSTHTRHKKGARVKLSELKALYGKPLFARELEDVNDAFFLSNREICKFCFCNHLRGCCRQYRCGAHTTCTFIENIELV